MEEELQRRREIARLRHAEKMSGKTSVESDEQPSTSSCTEGEIIAAMFYPVYFLYTFKSSDYKCSYWCR